MVGSLMDPAALRHIAHADGGLALTLVVTVLLAGFRHGFDIDHVAAISDIASGSSSRTRSFALATTYAVGHVVVVFALGLLAVFAGDSIPPSWDAVAARFIGATLIWLGLYVIYSAVRYRRDFRMQSRWMLVVAGVRRGLLWMRPSHPVIVEHDHEHAAEGHHQHSHEDNPPPPAIAASGHSLVVTRTNTHTHTHRHVVSMPSDPFTDYSPRTSFAIGMIHGIGAETPTQILLFTTAAGVTGAVGGVALVAVFAAGLLLGNSILTFASVAGASAGRRLPALYLALATTTAVISIGVGCAYLFEGLDPL